MHLTLSFNLVRVALTLLLMNISNDKGIIFCLVQVLATIDIFIGNCWMAIFLEFCNSLDLYAIYSYFIFNIGKKQKKDPSEYFKNIQSFFPYSMEQ